MVDTDRRPLYTEEAVGATHPTKNQVVGRQVGAFHDNAGRHKWTGGSSVASASSISVPDDENYFIVTGSTTITAIASTTSGGSGIDTGVIVAAKFNSALTLTHNGTSFIMPEAKDYSTKASEVLFFIHLGSGNWARVTGNTKSITELSDTPSSLGSSGEVLRMNSAGTAYISSESIRPNIIINGATNVWQRGTSFTGPTNEYTADRWKYVQSGAGVVDVTRQSDYPASATGYGSVYSLDVQVTTGDASIGASDYYKIQTVVEGYDFRPLHFQTATLSFWVKAYTPGTYCVSFSNGVDRTYIAEYTINSSATWEKKTITLDFDYSGGTWDYTTGAGLYIVWALAAGSNFTYTADTWASNLAIATSNQVNGVSGVNDYFNLTRVKLERGSVATEFVTRGAGYEEELAACQRYYEVKGGVAESMATYAYGETSAFITMSFSYAVEKRATPSITKVGTWAVSNCSQPTGYGTSTREFTLRSQVTSAGSAYFDNNSSDDVVTSDAEL